MSILATPGLRVSVGQATRIGSLCWVAVFSCGIAWAAEPEANICPRQLGFHFPRGRISRPEGETRVLTRGEKDEVVVAQLQVQVGDHIVVLLPNGRLVARKATEITPTERPFQPWSHKEIAQELASTRLKDFQFEQRSHFLYAYKGEEKWAGLTSGILGSMYGKIEGYAKENRLGPQVRKPRFPLVVIIFNSRKEFNQFKRVPPGVTAYYDTLTNYVVMCTEIDEKQNELAQRQLVATIAHEGVHQILHNIGVQNRLSIWPMWLSEGLAEYFAPTTTDGTWQGAGKPNDLRIYELENYLQDRGNAAAGELVLHTVMANKLKTTGYASSWALTHYLFKQQRKEFHQYVREVSKRGPFEGPSRVLPPGIAPGNLIAFKKYFGNDLVKLEKLVLTNIKKNMVYTDPFADTKHFAAGIALGRRREAKVRNRRTAAEKWLQDKVQSVAESDRDRIKSTVREFPNRYQAEQWSLLWVRASKVGY